MRRFFQRKSAAKAEMPPPVPEGLTYVIGDIHGRLDLLDRALDLIEQDRDGDTAKLVFLGDYVDRGPDSAGVLRRLFNLQIKGASSVCLMGNHERMMLDFLDDPDGRGARWLRNGGTETLSSFVTGRITPVDDQTRLEAVRDVFQTALGSELEAWLRGLPLSWRSGSLGCVHAMTDPSRNWDDQDPALLLWGRPSSVLKPRFDGIWVAHGHTIVARATVKGGHIALDTGAYRTGHLSFLRCDGKGARLLSTGD